MSHTVTDARDELHVLIHSGASQPSSTLPAQATLNSNGTRFAHNESVNAYASCIHERVNKYIEEKKQVRAECNLQ